MSFGSWSVLTTNFLFILYGALCAVTFCSILHLVNGKWRFQVRSIAAALLVLFVLAGVLLVVLLANPEKTFVWYAQDHANSAQHLNAWHHYRFLVARQVIGFILVTLLFAVFVKYQYLAGKGDNAVAQRRFRNIALLIPFAYVLYGSMVAWDFEMTMVPGWHSASYAPYHFVSNFHAFLGFFAILLFALERSGKLVTPFQSFVFNYVAQMMLAFTILWTYFFFTQYLVMWYGRLPTEMPRYIAMMYHDYGILFWGYVGLKFIIPFSALIFTNNRHDPAAISIIGGSILVGTWLERYTWIAGSTTLDQYHFPFSAWFDWLVTIGVFLVAYWIVRWSLRYYKVLKV